MVIKVAKNAIIIKCNPIIPFKFKCQLVKKLGEFYFIKDFNMKYFESDDRPDISEEEEKKYLEFYEHENFNYSFEEFLGLSLFPVGTLEIYSKNGNKKIAFIDFVPDGDVNTIWIDIFDAKSKEDLLNLIETISK